MSAIDRLVEKYADAVKVPWRDGLSAAERTWMLVYENRDERRLRANLEEFRIATQNAGHGWIGVDLTGEFERWLVGQEYVEDYYEHPSDISMLEGPLGRHLAESVSTKADGAGGSDVVALYGLGTLFGLYSVSKLIEQVAEDVPGRVLAFFPGRREGNNYRLLDAKDGWSYLAVPIDLSEGN